MIFFFDIGISIQSKKANSFAEKLDTYKKELNDKLQREYNSSNLPRIIDLLFENPYIRIKDIAEKLEISTPAAANLIKTLENKKILKETSGRKKNRFILHMKYSRYLRSSFFRT